MNTKKACLFTHFASQLTSSPTNVARDKKRNFLYSKNFFSILLSLIMIFKIFPLSSFADGDALLTPEELRLEKGAITIEAYNIGQGFLMEPTLFAKEGKSTGDITLDALKKKKIKYKGSTSYFSGFEFDDATEPIYPDYLGSYIGGLDTMGDCNGYLEEFDYSNNSGWCYTINDWWASYGADCSYPGGKITDYNTGEDVVLGDIIRWHFTVYGYGADCGFSSNTMAEYMGGNLFTQEDKSDLIFLLAAINDYYGNLDTDDVYETALVVAADPLATADTIARQEALLTSYIKDTFFDSSVKNEITKYDTKKVYFTFPDEGVSIIVIFADYEGSRLNNIKVLNRVTEKTDGENIMSVAIPSEIKLSVGDKIMLWGNFTTCMPLCKSYIINGTETLDN